MKNGILAVIGVLIFAFILYTYFTTLKEDYYIDRDSDIVVVSASRWSDTRSSGISPSL